MKIFPPASAIACLAASFFGLGGNVRAEPILGREMDLNQARRAFVPNLSGGAANPYNLIDLDGFDPGEFDHCRWGVYQSQGDLQGTQRLFTYSSLTASPVEKDLMVMTNLHALEHRYLLTRETMQPVATRGFLFKVPDQGKTYHLLRKHHFEIRGALVDARSGTPIPSTTEKAIVLIHGWNPGLVADAPADAYEAGALHDLVQRLGSELSLSDWKLIPYHWERDADTGIPLPSGDGFINATEAAEGSHCHGQHLGELLANTAPELKRVHLISHSAGAWAARSAAKYLMLKIPGIDLQVTLLDPFVPGDNPAIDTSLTAGRLSEFSGFTNPAAGKIWKLENYFSYDLTDFTSHGATSGHFGWSGSRHVERELLSEAYESHAGPIDFYRHSIDGAVDVSEVPEIRAGGWPDSMFRREPYFPMDFMTGQGGARQLGEAVTLEAFPTTRGGPLSSQATWQWHKNGEPIPGATGASLVIAAATSADAGTYHVEVADSGLTTRSGTAIITVEGGALAIVRDPLDQTVGEGDTATFRVHASGDSPAYQWLVDGMEIPGATGHSLVVPDVAQADSGRRYSVRVSDTSDTLTSGAALLAVTSAPPADVDEPNDSSIAATPFTRGTIHEGLISHSGDVDWFAIQATAGEHHVITLQVPAGVDYDLELYGPEATWASGSYLGTGHSEGIQFTAASAGTWWVRVLGYPTGGSSFDAQRPYALYAGALQGTFTYTEESDHVTVTGFTGDLAGPLVIPDTLGGKPVRAIAEFAFDECIGITSLTIPSGVTHVGGFSFYGCTGIASIALPPGLQSIAGHAFYGCAAIKSVEFNGGNLAVGNWAFGHCHGLQSVAIANDQLTLSQWAFGYCEGLQSVQFGDGQYAIGDWAFGYCEALVSVDFGNGDGTLGQWAFGECGALVALDFGDGDLDIGQHAFDGCGGLVSLAFGSGDISIGAWAFSSCASLAEVSFGAGSYTIGEHAFTACESLVSISLPLSLDAIAAGAFQGCTSLSSVSIPEGVATIGDRAFESCYPLLSITLPASIESIGDHAFAGCYQVKSVLFLGDAPALGEHVFTFTPGFFIYYVYGQSGFSSPVWEGWPAVEIGAPPRLIVRGADGETLANGSTLRFGRHPVLPGTEIEVPLTLANAGQAQLTGLSLEIAGDHAADFTVTAPQSATLPSAGHAGLPIRFSPLGSGTRSAVLRIASSDATAQPFEIHLEAEAYDPDIATAIDQPSHPILPSGSIEWERRTDESRDGVDSARSGPIGDGETSSFSMEVAGPVRVSFWWRTSSEEGHDFLRFTVNAAAHGDPVSGSGDWQQRVVTLGPGTHLLTWSYGKDDSGSSGLDAGFVDQLAITPDPRVLFEAWASAAGLQGAEAEPLAMPHADGLPNVLRYAFRMHPAGNSLRYLAEGDGSSGLPSIRRVVREPDSVLRFEFVRAKGRGLRYLPCKSRDLTSWHPLTATPTVTEIPGLEDWERVVIEEPVDAGATFGRLSVEFEDL